MERNIPKLYREFNDAGYPVIALYGKSKDGFCECGNPECTAFFKHPKENNWDSATIKEDEQIDTMELIGEFLTGYGILCNDLIIIDVDERNGGVESFNKLLEQCPTIALDCGFIVQSGSSANSKHYYFKKPENCPPLKGSLKEYKGVDFKSSGFVVGAGSLHNSGNTYEVLFGDPSEIAPAPEELITLLAKPKKEDDDCLKSAEFQELSLEQLKEVMSYIPNSSENMATYDEWLQIGMSLHDATKGGKEGLDLWYEFSIKGKKDEKKGTLINKWSSFGNSQEKYTVATLIQKAKENGYIPPLIDDGGYPEFESNINWNKKKSNIDLTKPPFLVGEITDWINKNSMYTRKNLAVGAALMAVSSCAGLNYRGIYNSSLNLMTFLVAASGTGKDNIYKKYASLLRGVGLAPAMHGSVISSQEIVRNLIDHQASFYNIDEFGEELEKYLKAQQRGGGHLESVNKTFMEIFTKANDYYSIAQTHKKIFKENILKEIGLIKTRQKENASLPKDPELLFRLEDRLTQLNNGIKEPFLNLIGYTTPNKFESLINLETTENGFLNRALILKEKEDNPKFNEDYKVVKAEEDREYQYLVNRLSHFYYQGHTQLDDRIERLADKPVQLPCSNENMELYTKIREEIFELAEEQKETLGFLSHYKRAFEQIIKISTILSLSTGEIQEEAILWAKEFVLNDVELKINLTSATVNEKKVIGLESKILTILDKEVGITFAGLANKMRKVKKEDLEKALMSLQKNKLVYEMDTRGSRGFGAKKYFLV